MKLLHKVKSAFKNNKLILLIFALFPYASSNFFTFSDYLLGFFIYLSFIVVPLFFIYRNLKEKSIIDLSFWIYILIFIGFAFFFQLNNLNFPWMDYRISTQHIVHAVLIFILGISSFIIGRYFFNKEYYTLKRDVSFKKFNLLTGLCFVMILFIISQVGLTALALPRVFYSQAIFQSNNLLLPLFSNLAETLLPLCIIITLYFFKNNQISKERLFITILLVFSFVNPIRSSRLEFFLLILIFYLYFIRFNSKLWAISLILGLTIIFPVADIFRSFEINNNNAGLFDFNKSFTSGDFDGPSGNLIAILYLKNYSYLFGSNYLGALLSYIPRSIWQGKPYGTGYTVSNGVGLEYPNIGINMWAEAYLAFGYIGVVIFFILFGKIIQHLQMNFEKDFFSYLLYIYFSCAMIFILRGEVFQVGLRLVPLILVCYLITSKTEEISTFKSP